MEVELHAFLRFTLDTGKCSAPEAGCSTPGQIEPTSIGQEAGRQWYSQNFWRLGRRIAMVAPNGNY